MKIGKRYIIGCIILCIISVAISIGVFYLETGLSTYTKFNNTLTEKWKTSTLFVVSTKEDPEEIREGYRNNMVDFGYFGNKMYVESGKYTAYGRDTYSKALVYYGKVKMGQKIDIYFKPDDYTLIACKVPVTNYVIGLVALLIISVILVMGARLANRFLKAEMDIGNAGEATVSIMDIPVCVTIIGFVVCFFLGMFIGNYKVGPKYTEINENTVQSIIEEYSLEIHDAPLADH